MQLRCGEVLRGHPGVLLLLHAACLVPHISELFPHSARREEERTRGVELEGEGGKEKERGKKKKRKKEERRRKSSPYSPFSFPGLNLDREDAENSRRVGCSGSGVERHSHQRYGR